MEDKIAGFTLFKKTREIDNKITEFLNNISEGGLVFEQAFKIYLEEGATVSFLQKREEESRFETKNDQLRRDIESQLYEHTLLPDSRADVLSLLEGLDKISNKYEGALYALEIERPKLPDFISEDIENLVKTVITCVEELVMSARSFFANGVVENTLHKVMFYEKEADKQGTALKRKIFDSSQLELAEKLHLRDVEKRIEDISDIAEDEADKLTILCVKRSF